MFFKVLVTRQISGTNRKDDNFTKGIVNFLPFFTGFDAAKKHLL